MGTSQFFKAVFCCCVAVNLLGCGGTQEDQWTKDRPQTYPASGIVLLDGKPLESATVLLRSSGEPARSSRALTNSKGEFVLTTFNEADGAVEGNHIAVVMKTETEKIPEGVDPELFSGVLKVTSLIPEDYGNFKKSGLTVDISEAGGNDKIIFKLSSK